MTVHGLCRACGKIITYIEPGLDPGYHITCGPNLGASVIFSEPTGPMPRDLAMQQDMTEVILWGWRSDHRSQQKMIGPSELGDPCERKIAFRIAGLPGVNERVDPWPALVGTAIHTWLEATVNGFQKVAGAQRWLTETEVYPDDLVVGHVDLYDLETRAVWDWKTMGTDRLREFKKVAREDPGTWPDHYKGYRQQVHTYGLGMKRLGYDVATVGLIAVPRAGWLSSMEVWSEEYDESIAKAGLDRMYAIAERVMELAVDQYPHQIEAIEAAPSRLCSFCDYYAPEPVNGIGCPGK